MIRTLQYIFSLLLLSSLALPAFAQPGDLPSEEVEVIKDFEAQLVEAEKLGLQPELPPLDTNQRKLVYTIPSKATSVEYLPPKIRPIAMKRDKVAQSYNGFLKLGYGIPSSPYAELAYSKIDPNKYAFGGHLRHHSANYNDLENQRFMETSGKVNGTYFFEQGYAVEGQLGFTADEVHFYGYDHTIDAYPREEVRQRFNVFDFKARLFNGEQTQGDINYSAETNFYALSDNYATDERGFDIKIGASKWFNNQHQARVDIITDFTNLEDTAKQTLHNFFLQPNFTLHGDLFKLKLGVNIAAHDDEFNFFPDIQASANIVGNQLAAFAGAEGSLRKNSFRALSDYNPFIISRVQLRNTNYHHFYGGVRGTLKIVDYRVQAGFKRARDLALFLTDATDTIRFDVLYDTVNVVNLQGTLNARPIKGLEIMVTLGQNFFSLENEEKAWHLPALDFNVGARYKTLEDKLTLKGELFIENGVPYRDLQGNVDNLNGLFDLNLGAEYQISENIAAFFDLNNIASNKRQRWFRYPTYGLNIMGGITARF
ncbi:MAG: hypothetical protein AAGG75_22230 [Bacteroidota bacterium]